MVGEAFVSAQLYSEVGGGGQWNAPYPAINVKQWVRPPLTSNQCHVSPPSWERTRQVPVSVIHSETSKPSIISHRAQIAHYALCILSQIFFSTTVPQHKDPSIFEQFVLYNLSWSQSQYPGAYPSILQCIPGAGTSESTHTIGNLEMPVHLTTCFWVAGGIKSIQRNMQSPHTKQGWDYQPWGCQCYPVSQLVIHIKRLIV